MKCPRCKYKSQIYAYKGRNWARCSHCDYEGAKESFFVNEKGEFLAKREGQKESPSA